MFKSYLIWWFHTSALIFLLHPIYSLFHTSAWQVRSLERSGLGSRSYYGLGFGGTRESASIEEVASWWKESIVEVAAGVGQSEWCMADEQHCGRVLMRAMMVVEEE
jgi:hypothetical protein